MKKMICATVLLVAILLSVCMTVGAAEVASSAGNIEITDVADGAAVEFVAGSTEKIDVSYGTGLNGYYLVMMLTPNENGKYIPTVDSIQYIDQATAANGSVDFMVYPKEMTAGKIMLYGAGVGGDDTNQLELATLERKISGVTIKGTVKSYTPKNEIVIELYAAGTADDDDTNCLYTTTVTASTGSGLTEQDFELKDVRPGTYDLVVKKTCHLNYTIKNVVVGKEDLDLTVSENENVKLITLLVGDVNEDGFINVNDLNLVWNANNYNKAVAEVNDVRADVNGDGLVNVNDLNLVWNAAHYNKSAVNSTFG